MVVWTADGCCASAIDTPRRLVRSGTSKLPPGFEPGAGMLGIVGTPFFGLGCTEAAMFRRIEGAATPITNAVFSCPFEYTQARKPVIAMKSKMIMSFPTY